MSERDVFDYGTTVRFEAEFYNQAGALTDPTTVTLKTRSPAGTTSTYTYGAAEITKDATGLFHKSIQLNVTGRWYYRWEATGTVAAVDEQELHVLRTEF